MLLHSSLKELVLVVMLVSPALGDTLLVEASNLPSAEELKVGGHYLVSGLRDCGIHQLGIWHCTQDGGAHQRRLQGFPPAISKWAPITPRCCLLPVAWLPVLLGESASSVEPKKAKGGAAALWSSAEEVDCPSGAGNWVVGGQRHLGAVEH